MRNNNEARNQGNVVEQVAIAAYKRGDMSNNIAQAMMDISSNMVFNKGYKINSIQGSPNRPFDAYADDGDIVVVEIKNGYHDSFKKEVYVQQVITNAYAIIQHNPGRTVRMVVIMSDKAGKVTKIDVTKSAMEIKNIFMDRCIMSNHVEDRAVANAEGDFKQAEIHSVAIKAIKEEKEAHYSKGSRA